jgi:hypothetical protein
VCGRPIVFAICSTVAAKVGWSLGVVAMLVARMSWLPSAQTTAWAL